MSDTPTSVHMVCSGNICRSPMAEIVLRSMLETAGIDGVRVTSSGTGGWHIGEVADPRAVAVLERHGYDGRTHRASQADRQALADHDLILVADSGHLRQIRALAPSAEQRRAVRLLREFDAVAVAAGTLELDDPWYGHTADFERCLAEIEAACRGLVEHLRRPGHEAKA